MKPTTYLENAYQDDSGMVNFFEESYTQNGRAVFEMSDLLHYRDARDVGTVDYLLILNRNQNIIPAVAKLSQEQAAAYFMLGETTGTSAGGAAEAGNFLRVPGTNPFFPLPHGLQGNRILELLASHPIETYLLNTGRVGGKDDDDRSKKLKIPHTSACVKGIAEGRRSPSSRTRTSDTWSRSPCRTSTTSSSCSRAVSTSVRVGATSTRRSSIG